jgi:hypothetical protein
MTRFTPVKLALKRGAFVLAANWEVVVIQFVAESTFKILLLVPSVGGAILVALLLGGDLKELLSGDRRASLPRIAAALSAQPAALAAFLVALALVVVGGSLLMFLLKAGTVHVLAEAERLAGPIERPPLRLAVFRRAAHFSVPRYLEGCVRFSRRYLRLGFVLLAAYAVTVVAYVFLMFTTYGLAVGPGTLVGWTLVTAVVTSVFIAWITLVNLFYLLTQMVIAVRDATVWDAAREVVRFVGSRAATVAMVFLVVLALVILATLASILATAGLGLIGFVPIVGLVVLPLQVLAWLLRGLVFQYLGLTALGAYLTLYRSPADATAVTTGPEPSWVRTA